MKSTNAKLKSLALLCLVSLVAASCGEDPVVTPPPTVVKEWSIPLSTKNENPSIANRNETGTAALQLLSDNSLKYTINVTGLASGDALVAAHIHTGNVITNGGVILGLNPVFSGGTSSGTITNLRTSLVDSLKNDVNELYFNVHSTQVSSGLVRGQLNTKVVKEWSIPLSTKNENPGIANRNETGTATLQLLSDNSLKYTINVTGLASGDALVAAHIHTGDVITNGGVILGLNPVFSGGTSSGIITNLRTSLVDSLKNDVNELYFNVHSTQVGSGLVRGQLNTQLEMVANVVMNGANEVPAITTTATGVGLLRLTSNKKLYSRVTISNLETGDVMNAAHIHTGAAGANGPVYIGLYASTAEFGTAKILTVTDAQIDVLKTGALYVNAHSTIRPTGVVRGQVR